MNTARANNSSKNFSHTVSVFTELPDTSVPQRIRGHVFYDADCSLCNELLNRFGTIFEKRGFAFVPLQKAIVSRISKIPPEEFQREMKLFKTNDHWKGGADAWIELFAAVWYLQPISWLARRPGLNVIAHAAYRKIAAHRHCLNGTCNSKKGTMK